MTTVVNSDKNTLIQAINFCADREKITNLWQKHLFEACFWMFVVVTVGYAVYVSLPDYYDFSASFMKDILKDIYICGSILSVGIIGVSAFLWHQKKQELMKQASGQILYKLLKDSMNMANNTQHDYVLNLLKHTRSTFEDKEWGDLLIACCNDGKISKEMYQRIVQVNPQIEDIHSKIFHSGVITQEFSREWTQVSIMHQRRQKDVCCN